MVHCKKCKAQNPDDRRKCQRCGADLLPGHGIGTRMPILLFGFLVTAGTAYVAYYLFDLHGNFIVRAGTDIENPLIPEWLYWCGSPLLWGIAAIWFLIGSLYYGVRKTPFYERYRERAKHHVDLDVEQALADFSQALLLAPEKERAAILQERAKLYESLGRETEATRDRLAYTIESGAYQTGASTMSLLGLDEDQHKADRGTSERKLLVKEGKAVALGYCTKCENYVVLSQRLRCQTHSRTKGKAVRYVATGDIDQAKVELLQAHLEPKRRNWSNLVLRVLGVIILVVVAIYLVNWITSDRPATPSPNQPQATVTQVSAAPVRQIIFQEDRFSFEYPSNWQKITTTDIQTLLRTSLKGMQKNQYEYIGGVYTSGLDNCPSCGQIVVIVLKDPILPGSLSEEQFNQIRAESVEKMGDRLISIDKTDFGSMPAYELVHIGASRKTKLWELTVFPPEPGMVFVFSCSANINSYSEYANVFQRTMETLTINGEPRASPTIQSTSQLTATPTPVIQIQLDAIVLQPEINVRSGPSKEYQIIASLEKEAEIIAVGRTEDQTWLYIKTNESEGWIYSPLVKVYGSIDELPLKTPELPQDN